MWVYGVWAGDGAERREGRQRVVKEKTTRGEEGGGRGEGRERDSRWWSAGGRVNGEQGGTKDAK